MKLTARIKARVAPPEAPPIPTGHAHHHSHWHKALLAQLTPERIRSMETSLSFDGVMTVSVEYALPSTLFSLDPVPPFPTLPLKPKAGKLFTGGG